MHAHSERADSKCVTARQAHDERQAREARLHKRSIRKGEQGHDAGTCRAVMDECRERWVDEASPCDDGDGAISMQASGGQRDGEARRARRRPPADDDACCYKARTPDAMARWLQQVAWRDAERATTVPWRGVGEEVEQAWLDAATTG